VTEAALLGSRAASFCIGLEQQLLDKGLKPCPMRRVAAIQQRIDFQTGLSELRHYILDFSISVRY
jgi:hypothetical protein